MNQAEVARTRQELRTARECTGRAQVRVKVMMNDTRLASCWRDELIDVRRYLSDAMNACANADHRLAIHARLDTPDGYPTPYDQWTAHPPVEPVDVDQLNAEITALLQAIHDTHDITEAGTIHFGQTIYPGVAQ